MTLPPARRSAPHPWLRPLYRRVGVLAVCVAWLALELTFQDQLWILIAAGATAWCAWDMFLSGTYRQKPLPDPGDGGPEGR